MRNNFDPAIFKAYDIRGIYPNQIDNDIAYAMGQGYASVIKPAKPVVIGCDVRLHSEELKDAMIQGLVDAGIDVVDIGLISTEMIYFATGYYGYGGGIQVTASHNPAEWHGAKMVREKAEPISSETGLFEIRDFVASGEKIVFDKKGTITKKNVLDDFCNYVLTWIDAKKINPLKLVYNPNFGFEGKVLNRIMEISKLPLTLIPLNAEPDGNFPKGRPDPFVPENREETIALIKKEKPDLGVAWDADADRVFFFLEDGRFLDSYFTNTLLIKYMLEKHPASKVVYDPRYTWALIDTTKNSGGTPILERVGHAFIKARMRKEDAVFSGESSGHTYYRDFWYADSGIIPLLQILEIMSKEGKPLTTLLAETLNKYFITGEINFTTEKGKEIMAKAENEYSDSEISKIDGVSCEYSDWRFNLRCSNTEPLLRLNLEAKSAKLLEEKKNEILNFIESNK
ncbi:MAG: phosphomannomutase/phosphoglucomutase [Patescibacteria group bacterium]|nr:phosphomannomutase/phosphoglucomutase [Patescibacteria group bacterium]